MEKDLENQTFVLLFLQNCELISEETIRCLERINNCTLVQLEVMFNV